jgi:hypothetical protein
MPQREQLRQATPAFLESIEFGEHASEISLTDDGQLYHSSESAGQP